MCEECDEFPALYVAYFNKPGGKLWRPARREAAPSAPAQGPLPGSQPAAAASRGFACVGVPVVWASAQTPSAPAAPAQRSHGDDAAPPPPAPAPTPAELE